MLTATTPDNREFVRLLRDGTGCTTYLYSPTPLAINRTLFNRLNAAVPMLLDLVDRPEYAAHCQQQGFWSLPVHPMRTVDFTGCADFLLTENGAKLIEINLNLPGKTGLMQLLGEATVALLHQPAEQTTNLRYLETLVTTIRKAIPTDGKIALVVSHLINSAKHQPHYRFFADQLNACGLNVDVVQACDLALHENGCTAYGETYTGMINLVIPFVWERNPDDFRQWTAVWQQHPSRVFPHPTGGMLGTKDVLRYLDSLRPADTSGSWENYVLKARMLEAFPDSEALFSWLSPAQMVLKPLKDYDTKGVYVQPDRATAERLLFTRPTDYMVQEFTESLQPRFLLPEGGTTQAHSVIYRVFFAEKQPIGYQAYYVSGAFDGDYYTAPVIIAND